MPVNPHSEVPALPNPQCHHDSRGWLRELWRLDRVPSLKLARMRLLWLTPGERAGLYTWFHHSASLSLCSGEVRLWLTEAGSTTPQQRALVPGQTVVLPAGTRWGLQADSDAVLLCALAGRADSHIDWTSGA